MDRKRKLVTAGAISATATAGLIAVAASVGVFGLSDNPPQVGKLSPIDATRSTTSKTPDDVQTIIVDDVPATSGVPGTPGATVGTTPGTRAGTAGTTATTTVTAPRLDDHGDDGLEPGDDHGGDRVESRDDSSGPGSHAGVDNSGPGSERSGRDHDEDD
jgi:hypothetical protein